MKGGLDNRARLLRGHHDSGGVLRFWLSGDHKMTEVIIVAVIVLSGKQCRGFISVSSSPVIYQDIRMTTAQSSKSMNSCCVIFESNMMPPARVSGARDRDPP